MIPPAWIFRGSMATLPAAPDRAIYAICWAVALLSVIYALRKFDTSRVAASTAVVGALFMAYLFIFAMPAADRWRGEKQFAQDIRHQMGAATTGVVLYKAIGPLYYLNLPDPLPYYDDLAKLRGDVLENKVRWVIVRRRDRQSLQDVLNQLGNAGAVAASERAFPFEGRQHVLNKELLVAVEPPGANALPSTAAPPTNALPTVP
jgi:hypothetical protein